MKKRVVMILALSTLVVLAWTGQVQKEKSKLKPRITAVSQKNYPAYVEIVLSGWRFPVPRNGYQIMVGDYLLVPGSCWSATEACGGLPANIQSGNTYPVCIAHNLTKEIITNKVDYFILYNLYEINPSSGLAPGTTVEVLSALPLGNKGTKVIKFNNTVVNPISWQAGKFKFKIPNNTDVPSKNVVFLEDQGTRISNEISIILPPPINH